MGRRQRRWNGDPQTAPDVDEGTLISFDPSHGPDCVACQRRDTHEMGAFGVVTDDLRGDGPDRKRSTPLQQDDRPENVGTPHAHPERRAS